MVGKVHYAAGLAVGLTTSYFLTKSEPNLFVMLAGTFAGGAGGLFPDIDNKYSTISRKLCRLSKIFQVVTEHRGATHSLFFLSMLALSTLLSWRFLHLPFWLFVTAVSFLCGMFMHLVQDTFTRGGVPWLYPVSRWRYSLSPFRTGCKGEGFFSVILVLGYVEILHFFVYEEFFFPTLPL